MMTNMGYGLVLSIIAAISVGVLVGIFQGILTAYAGIPAFIVTLGGLLGWRGAIKACRSLRRYRSPIPYLNLSARATSLRMSVGYSPALRWSRS